MFFEIKKRVDRFEFHTPPEVVFFTVRENMPIERTGIRLPELRGCVASVDLEWRKDRFVQITEREAVETDDLSV